MPNNTPQSLAGIELPPLVEKSNPIERAKQHFDIINSNDCYIDAICSLIIAAGDNLENNHPIELAAKLIKDMSSDMSRHSLRMLSLIEACEVVNHEK